MRYIACFCVSLAAMMPGNSQGATPVCEIRATGSDSPIGTIGGQIDAVLFSGYQVVLLSNGQLAIHDPVKGKLLVFARKGEGFDCSTPISTVQLGGPPISAIAKFDEVIYGIDLAGTVRRIYPALTNSPKGEASGPAESNNPSKREHQLIVSALALSHPWHRGKAIWPGTKDDASTAVRATGEIGLSPDENRLVSVPSGTILINGVEYRHALTWHGTDRGTLKIWKSASPQDLSELPIVVPGILGAVDILRATPTGFMVAVESVDLDKDGRVRVEDHHFSFDAKGEVKDHRVSAVPAPSAAGRWTPMDTPALSDPLDESRLLYFFRSENALISVAVDLRQTRAVSLAGQSTGISFVDPDPRRNALISRAEEFINASWRAEAKNLNQSNQNWSCSPPYATNANRWAQPIFLRSLRPGAEIYGVPYLWGGKAGWKDYLAKMKAGGIAGNVCTKVVRGEAVSVPGAAGIDCSGFVSRVWELRGARRVDLSTTALSTDKYSRRIESLAALQPGDILNKASAHVRLFAGWVRTPFGLRIRSYESTTDSICSGTCMRDLRPRAYVGYVPRGYPG